MVRAAGSYPAGRRFDSDRRYQDKTTAQVGNKYIPLRYAKAATQNAEGMAVNGTLRVPERSGPMVKRLRHHPFTVVSWVRIPLGSPNKLKANPFPLGDGFAFIIFFHK